MEMKNDIVIVLSEHDYSCQAIRQEGYIVKPPYIGNFTLFRIFREISFKFKLPGRSFWYNKKTVNESTKIYIVYDALITIDYLYWLRKKNPDSRIIYLYTDPVDMAINPEKLPDELCEKWSSDFLDCEKYNLRRAGSGGYLSSWKVSKKEAKYDVFYIGRDKGRLEYLLKLQRQFETIGLKTNFYITAHHRWQRFKNRIYRPLVPYTEVLNMLGETRSILHLTAGGYKGISIRVMESIIHNIKLITDNEYLMQLDVYNPNNFFILGVDDLAELPAFLEKPYEPYDSERIKALMFDNRITTILENKNCDK